jgi:NhaP-type Na+/H+ or K+/H+ antiporter
MLGLASLLVLGIGAQWISWRLRQPSILLLLVCGFVAGPVTGWLKPDALLGDLLVPIVSLSVALILFEGGLSLDLREIHGLRGVILRLVFVGGAVTLAISTAAAHLLLGLDLGLALLLGAVIVVSGPTVIVPILRQVRPNRTIASVLKWEAMVNDPIGAMAAVLIFQALLTTDLTQALTSVGLGLLKTVIVGVLVGGGAALLLVFLLEHDWIPDYLDSPVTLMTTIAAFVASNELQHESGLIAVTLMGAFLANQRRVAVRHVIEFKENLRVLLLGGLFILLAARLTREDMAGLGWASLGFLAVLLLVARPLSVLASTVGSPLGRPERIFLSWMHPRGVVSAAVAAIFALRLTEVGHEGAERLVPLTFLVIVGTIVVHGLSAGPLARRLGLSRADPQGLLVIGAAPWIRRLAKVLKDAGFDVLLVDSNRGRVAKARLEGLRSWHGDALEEHSADEIDLAGLGRMLALTPNDHVNSLCSLHYLDVFGRAASYQLVDPREAGSAEEPRPHHLRGRSLWHSELTHERLVELSEDGWEFKRTPLTEEFGLEEFFAEHGTGAKPLFVVARDTSLRVVLAGTKPSAEPGEALISLVPPDPDAPER